MDMLLLHKLRLTSPKASFKWPMALAKSQFFRESDIVCFDIGSHLGSFTSELLNCFGEKKNLRIIAFDAHKDHLELSSREINDERVAFEQFAVIANSSQKKFTTFSIPRHSLRQVDGFNVSGGGRSVDQIPLERRGRLSGDFQFEVPCISLDVYLKERDLAAPSIIKLDIQGGEMNALKGLGNQLTQAQVIYCECQLNRHENLAWIDYFKTRKFEVFLDNFWIIFKPEAFAFRREVLEMMGIEILLDAPKMKAVHAYSKKGDHFLSYLDKESPFCSFFVCFQTDLLMINGRNRFLVTDFSNLVLEND